MKVKILKRGGGDPMKPPYEEIVRRNKEGANKWNEKYAQLLEFLKQKYPNKAPEKIKNHEQYQRLIMETPELKEQLLKDITSDEMPITNKGRKLLKKAGVKNADQIGSFSQLPEKFQNEEFILQQYNDKIGGQGVPAHRGVNAPIEDKRKPIDFEDENALPGLKQTESNEYGYDGKGNKKNPYAKRNLPFYQAAPELAGFVSALNTYNYYTPDYTHWEVNPATLNIQPQLQSIDASANAFYQTTTGNPSVDNARKSAAFVQGLNAKQQAFANKQNYDANARVQADQFNISARTNEQNLDVQATDRVHNNYRALAKDYAAGERLRAISSLTTKEARNRQNEVEKSLWLDNFFQNVEFDKNGQLITSGDPFNFQDNPYGNFNMEETEGAKTTTTTNTKAPIITNQSSNFAVPPVDTPGKELNMEPIARNLSPSWLDQSSEMERIPSNEVRLKPVWDYFNNTPIMEPEPETIEETPGFVPSSSFDPGTNRRRSKSVDYFENGGMKPIKNRYRLPY